MKDAIGILPDTGGSGGDFWKHLQIRDDIMNITRADGQASKALGLRIIRKLGETFVVSKK
jgi:hypothetical protein